MKAVVFEQRDVLGGTWAYEDIDAKKPNSKLFSSIYANLRWTPPSVLILSLSYSYSLIYSQCLNVPRYFGRRVPHCKDSLRSHLQNKHPNAYFGRFFNNSCSGRFSWFSAIITPNTFYQNKLLRKLSGDRPNQSRTIFIRYIWTFRTNLPKQVMMFPDFPYDENLPTYLHHTDVCTYLSQYADHYHLRQYVRFNTKVRFFTTHKPHETLGFL